ncbi:hypothetical protein ACIBM4_07490 [Streptomyces sp. NPDC050256]|uniref:hypothetical protein n=1 Tax=Streptomyces sp. NPDC050256 TaxID=3365607 RepID=UPI0037B44C8F
MTRGKLPTGWTLEEIRRVSGDREAVALDADRSVKWVVTPGRYAESERLHPEIVLGFHGLCLVKPVDDEDWYMGSLYDDGSVDCWSAYSDLYEALRGL